VLNKNSNGYILIYTAILTVFCAAALYITAQVLKPAQDENIKLAQKESILATVLKIDDTWDKNKINKVYDERVKGMVLDYNGNVVAGKKVEDINVEAECKKPLKERMLPLYEIASENDKTKVEYYVIATSGKGLWDKISSFMSIKADLETVNGIVFDHKAETPGLGARIKDDEAVYSRYAGKSIYNEGKITPIKMMKGEGNDYSNNKHAVDGMSGATKTAEGVNDMIAEYLTAYDNYFKNKKSKN